jgi:hypothetical protein
VYNHEDEGFRVFPSRQQSLCRNGKQSTSHEMYHGLSVRLSGCCTHVDDGSQELTAMMRSGRCISSSWTPVLMPVSVIVIVIVVIPIAAVYPHDSIVIGCGTSPFPSFAPRQARLFITAVMTRRNNTSRQGKFGSFARPSSGS